jgi:hypothetical protein
MSTGTETGRGSVQVKQMDLAGNTSAVGSNVATITVDGSAPAAPTLALATDTGASGSDGITSNGGMTVSGLETGASWQYSTNGGSTWATGTGTSFTLPAGTYAIGVVQVRQTDLAGNTGPSGSNTTAITIDASALALSLSLATDTGFSNSDGITSNGVVTVSGIETGASWQYSTNSGSTWTNSAGSSFTLPAGTYAVGVVQVRQTDLAGNTSPVRSNAATITVDATALAPTLSLASDTGSSNSDGVTSNGLMNVAGVLGGATWERSTDGGATWTAGTGSTFTLPSGTYAAGRVQIRQIAGSSRSGEFANGATITVDTVAPNTPVLALGTGIADGASAVEAVQASGVVLVTGELGAAIAVTFRRGSGTPVTKNLTGTGAPQAVVLANADVTTLGDGTVAVSATQTDVAGNPQSAAAATTSFDLNTTPPPALVLGTGVANGASVAEATQLTGVVLITGESTAAITVTFTRNATVITKNLVGTGAAQPVTLTNADVTALGSGAVTVSATQTRSGSSLASSPSTTSFTLDATPPAAPTLALVAGVANGVTLAEATRAAGVVTVAGEPGATVVVVLRRGAGTPVTKILTGTGARQRVSLTAAEVTTLGNGLISVSATQTDATGNAQTAAPSTSSFTIDTVRPTVSNVTSSLPNGVYASGQAIPIEITFREPVFVTGTPTLLLNTTPQRTATYLSGSGTTTLTFRYVVVAGDTAADLNYASRTALSGGRIADAAGNLAIATLPALAGTGSLATNKNIVIDGSLQAVASGFGNSPDGPSFSTAVRSVPITFTAPVTGVSIASFQLYYEGRLVSLRGATVSGSGTTWTLSLPSTATNLRGRYRLDIGGPTSGIQADGVVMTRVTSIYWQRV